MASAWIGSRRKRALDLALAGPALLVLSPVIVITAVAVARRLGRPVLFRQARAGRHDATLRIAKFRTMTDTRDADGELLPDEDRLTAFGAKLRATSLDELPQLWSVITGEMSLIGPRPLPTAYVERYSDEQRRRLDARPGITGWAQVNGRNDTTWPARLRNDVWYVDNASFKLDLRILAMTARTAISGSGVSASGHVTMPEFLGTEIDEPGDDVHGSRS